MDYRDIYLESRGLTRIDDIFCEVCGQVAVDVHHIEPRGMGGSKFRDVPENLIALCRNCHELAEQKKMSKEYLKRCKI